MVDGVFHRFKLILESWNEMNSNGFEKTKFARKHVDTMRLSKNDTIH
jgi:hypothetical protein